MKKLLKRYMIAIIITAAFFAFAFLFPAYREKSFSSIVYQLKTMLLVMPPIFILLGLIDVWVPREKMIKYMGQGSGLKGWILSFLLGSFAAGPLYAAFPLAAVLMKKGASFLNILILIGAWSTTKIPMLIFEATSLGARFAMSRFAIDIVGIILIAGVIQATLTKNELVYI